MRLLFAIVLLVSSSSFAYTSGTYDCTSNAGWDKYTLIISDVTLAPGIKLPYVEYTKRSTKTVGIAAVSSDDVSERLYIGANNGQSLISFGKDGSVISECKIHN